MRSPSMIPKSESQKLSELFAKPNAFLIQAYPLQSMLRLPMDLRLEVMRRQVSYKEPQPHPRPAQVKVSGMVVSPEKLVAERRQAERIQRELNDLNPLKMGLDAAEEYLQETVAEEIREALHLSDAVSAEGAVVALFEDVAERTLVSAGEAVVDLATEVEYQLGRL
ncbi:MULTISPECIES: hypothetical protein [Pseudomonadaceae]|jgi:hypothetical protein|uniref:Uncharacterized protein n=1 Tax=Stutzerimonas stutzeri TaxID=316 RepID=A0ABD4XXA1_STUST|nr:MULTISPECIES: hypothetical protein [Pseudomonadaceae]KJS23038.1 MAG: hypothetical protein VR76_14935 [Pseudomonas sp. BRH_c35]MBZ3679474.1 hypothetical protein [Pseudomonas aeruginosa]MBZ3690875.1 hypothetical protein [Pseudomonas aeruginosa]MDH0686897.1 hypothetical protein [Stutzerimonas stutzeri]